jgi:hypothetical protein
LTVRPVLLLVAALNSEELVNTKPIPHHIVHKVVSNPLVIIYMQDPHQVNLLKVAAHLFNQVVYNKVANMLQLVVFTMILIHKLFDEQQLVVQ